MMREQTRCQVCLQEQEINVQHVSRQFILLTRLLLMGVRITRAASNAAMEVAQSAHPTILPMREIYIANITISNSSKRKATLVSLKGTSKRRWGLRNQPAPKPRHDYALVAVWFLIITMC